MIYLRESARAGECRRGRHRERESWADSVLSLEPDVGSISPLWGPEQKPGVGHLTNCATQASPVLHFKFLRKVWHLQTSTALPLSNITDRTVLPASPTGSGTYASTLARLCLTKHLYARSRAKTLQGFQIYSEDLAVMVIWHGWKMA